MRYILTGIIMFLPLFAHAQLGLGKSSGKEPIDITADQFDVYQDKGKAVFTGNVIAKQGTMTIQSNVMTAYYKTQKKAGGNTISRIEVDGNVVIVTPEETGKGNHGVYNVDTKLITLEGDVVLVKDKNVLKGSTLEYNLVTGQSSLKGGVSSTVQGAKTSGRVKAIFVPENK